MTVAAMPACVVADPAPQQPRTTTTRANPPPPEPEKQPDQKPEPPPPVDPVVEPETPDYHRNWTVMLADDGQCTAYLAVECKTGATCNPPAPRPIACPDGITASRPVDIFASAGSNDCYIKPPEVSCPAKATCNPPPPRKTACPK